jgi:hypothetical protein
VLADDCDCGTVQNVLAYHEPDTGCAFAQMIARVVTRVWFAGKAGRSAQMDINIAN